jgi:HAD superfamily hydrolase (TIGR01484 family)
MRPIDEMPATTCSQIETVFTDIDDTITSAGLVPRAAYDALWDARDAGLKVVLVTGRPAGWCDHLARMWPVSAVVGENGALCFAMQEGRIRRIYAPRPDDAKPRLDAIEKQVLAEVAGARVAADQAYREYDLAVDFAEEVTPPLDEAAIDRIVAIFEEHGATAKVSSIHVNGWFGDFDKLSMCKRYAEELVGEALDVRRATFCGDSPNDVPMFAHFPHACGVANVKAFAHRMNALPAYVAAHEGGAGFAEILTHLLAHR